MLLSATLGSLLSGVAVGRHPARLVTTGERPYVPSLSGIEIACSAASLESPACAQWAARHRQSVDAVGAGEVEAALAVGVLPARIGAHCDDLTDSEMLWAASIGVGRLVVSCRHQADVLAAVRAPGPLNVWLQSGRDIELLRGRPGLRLVGLDAHCAGFHRYDDLVDDLMIELAELRRRSGIVLGHLGISGVHVDAESVYEIDDAVTDGCIRHRVPRPQLVLSDSLLVA